MSKKRVYELAKELGIDSKELIARLEKFGIAVKSHSSTVEDADMEKIQRELLSPEPLEMVEKRIKSTVIRRRVVRPPVEEFKGDSVKVEAEIPVTLEGKGVLAREVQEEKREPVISRQETSVESAAPSAPQQVSVDRVKRHEELIGEEKPTVKVEGKIEQKVVVKTDVKADVKADVKVEVKPDFRIEKKPDAKLEMKPEIREEVKPDLKREAAARAEEGVVAKKREEEKVFLKRETKEAVEEILTKGEEVAGKVLEVTVPVQPVESVEVPGERKVPPGVLHEKVTEEVRKEPSEKPELKIVKEIVPPSPEKLAKWEIEKPKVKGKKTVEVIMEELPSARKKAFIKKLVDRRDWRGEEDREDRILKWREGKKALPAKVKKTVITVPKAIKRRIKIGETITVGELAKRMGVKASEVINKLMGLGLMVTINQSIDCDAATIIAGEFGYQVEPVGAEFDEPIQREEPSSEKMRPRAPVVTVMGHVDHGKTSLLDAIRQTNVIDGEVGGITQAIGAYHVTIKDREIVFLDTPGHEAFTAMRARGAHVTDIVVLVVAADDGVMDQTVEAINHARVANVPIIVAINKIDKPGADPGRIKQSLAEYNLVPEEWGGDTIYCEVSAKKKIGIEELLEMILLQADVMELKADPDRPARGVIIESKLDRGRGAVATVLIQEGTLREGDAFVAKTEYGKVRAMVDDQGRRVKEAYPSMPVEVIGFSGVPQVGAEFICVEDEKKARSIAEYWIRRERERELSATSKITLEQLYQKMKEGVKELNVIIKGDVQGSIEALTEALNKLSTQDIRVKIIHSSTGAVTETDVMLASASNAIIIGFNVRPDSRVIDIAEKEGVEIKLYEIIYDVIADMRAAMEGLLEPEYKEVVIGRAEVRELFRIPKVGTVAGCYVAEGKVTRNANVKLVRDGILIYDGRIHSLKRFKDDVKEVTSGLECGIGIEGFNDLSVGDVIEAYVKEKVEKKLQ